MKDYYFDEQKINILNDSVARRIAAGEVIDRPQAVIRELMDNSIDAGASEINVYIKGGGIEEIRIIDNGTGMNSADLKKCFLPHATSKIKNFEDIYLVKSLGFRGEALSSIASCSKLSIVSSVSDSTIAHKIEIRDGKITNFTESKGSKGTVINVKDIFYSMPGRKNFLKSVSTESAQCKSMFIEKAIAHNKIAFKYFVNDKLVLFFPKSDLKNRIQVAYGNLFHNSSLYDISAEIESVSLNAVLGGLSLYRKDRKYIHTFINNRRVSEYSLVHAIDYAFSKYLPGGCHPVCFLFLEIPPKHVDFNIHPAKREVKFRNLPTIHNTITQFIENFLSVKNKVSFLKSTSSSFAHEIQQDFTDSKYLNNNSRQQYYNFPKFKTTEFFNTTKKEITNNNLFQQIRLNEIANKFKKTEQPNSNNLLFLGQLFNLFLLFEKQDNLLIIDQHAAHEKIIFDTLSSKQPHIQELLIPLELKLEKEEQFKIEKHLTTFKEMGFELQKVEENFWLINAMPSICKGIEKKIIDFFKNKVTDEKELKKEFFAQVSCKSAIKDGDSLDSITALELATKVLKMENPRCPHGRPIINYISRDNLFNMFGRTF